MYKVKERKKKTRRIIEKFNIEDENIQQKCYKIYFRIMKIYIEKRR